jgi:LysR family glycine cleavage system transcriptional activator
MADDKAPSWRMWLEAAGINNVDPERRSRFNVDSLVVQAAIAGHGVAQANGALIADDLAAGRLVRPLSAGEGRADRFRLSSGLS